MNLKWWEKKEEIKPVELEPNEFKQVIDIAKGDYQRISEECEGKVIDVEKTWNDKLNEIESKWKAEYDKASEEEATQIPKVRQAMEELKVKYQQYDDWLAKAPEAFLARKEYIKQQCKAEMDAALHQKELAVSCLRREYQDRLDSRKPIVDKMERAIPK
jgi:hypothetical protein